MDPKWIVLLALALGSAYRLILALVQRRSAGNPTPENVADVYDANTYRRWKDYSAENSRLEIVSVLLSFASLALLLIFDVHAAVAARFPQGIFLQLLAVVLLQTVVDGIIGSAVAYVSTMVIEQKYGFNRSTGKTFVLDRLRAFVLELLLNVGLMCLLAGLYRRMGNWVVLLFTAAVFAVTLAISFLYPVFSRIGNKFVPLEEGELRARLMELLTAHGYQVKAIEVMDASRRTTKLNAYFTGFGKLKTIVLYDNLLNAMSADEICAVFAHELGHGLHKDVLKMQVMNLGNLLIMAVTVWLAVRLEVLHTAFGFTGVNYGFVNILLGIFMGLLQPLTGMAMNAYSRAAEYRADRQAVKEGYGKAMINGLKRLGRENFAHLAPSRLLVVLEYGHPPLSSRIAAIEEAMK